MNPSDESIIEIDHALIADGPDSDPEDGVSMLLKKNDHDFEIVLTKSEIKYLLQVANQDNEVRK